MHWFLTTSAEDIPSFASLFICAGHALAGSEVDGAGAGGVSALPVNVAPPPSSLAVLHSLSDCGRRERHMFISQTTQKTSTGITRPTLKVYSDVFKHTL